MIPALCTVAVAALATFLTRALPFWLFPAGRQPPAFVTFLGRRLPAAAMAMLVAYCLKDLSFAAPGGWLPTLAGCAVTAALHAWRHKMILSIAGGTGAYMLLLRLLG